MSQPTSSALFRSFREEAIGGNPDVAPRPVQPVVAVTMGFDAVSPDHLNRRLSVPLYVTLCDHSGFGRAVHPHLHHAV